ncbi:MAG: hypothetical protein ABFC89_13815 [Methanospirillum sp.]
MRGRRNEDALSEIIGFVLILALVVVASTLYLLYVVPAEGREDEITHMNQVQDRFVSYKTSVDGLWMRADSSTETRGVSLSTSFDLGTGGGNTQSSGMFLSFMRPIGTAAKMSIDGEQGDTITVRVDGQLVNVSGVFPLLNVPPGYVNYTTDNYYWIQQSYSYEMGGVFLEQAREGVSVKVSPALSLYKYGYKNNTDNVKLNLCLIKVMGASKTVGGTGPLRIETRLREDFESMDRSPEDPADNVTITVKARNQYWARAWHQVFIDAVNRDQNLGANTSWYKITPETSSEITADPNSWTIELNLPNETSPQAPGPGHVLPAIKWASTQVTFEYADNG